MGQRDVVAQHNQCMISVSQKAVLTLTGEHRDSCRPLARRPAGSTQAVPGGQGNRLGLDDDDEQPGLCYDGGGDEDAAYEVRLKGTGARGRRPPGMFDLRVDDAVTGDGDICQVASDAPDIDDSHSYDG
ncbi:hypothetical protein DL766_003796 [Monosporascus sp. MC13-8B]|nr:hypothetical protein DL766_003796 [Monosporascus sp. MC13-8B]